MTDHVKIVMSQDKIV